MKKRAELYFIAVSTFFTKLNQEHTVRKCDFDMIYNTILFREELEEKLKNVQKQKSDALRKVSILSNHISKSVFEDVVRTGNIT